MNSLELENSVVLLHVDAYQFAFFGLQFCLRRGPVVQIQKGEIHHILQVSHD